MLNVHFCNYLTVVLTLIVRKQQSERVFAQRRFFRLLWSPGIDQEIDSASLCSLAGRHDNPIPTRFLVPIDFLQMPAQVE
jgi:hypothetical protein